MSETDQVKKAVVCLGTKVHLRSGGPLMTVVRWDNHSVDTAVCGWFSSWPPIYQEITTNVAALTTGAI